MIGLSTNHVAAAGAGLLIAWSVYRFRPNASREPFLPLLAFGASTILTATGLDQKIAKAVINKVAPKKDDVKYVGRQWDGQDWSCPMNTIETGMDNSKACIASQFHPPIWRWDGKEWNHSCPNGTVPTGDAQWERKCEAGYVGRVFMDGKWQCPSGTTDTGKNWDAGPVEGAKQCKRGGPYTVRFHDGKKWRCPDFSTDTGRSWGQPGEWNQCKWTA